MQPSTPTSQDSEKRSKREKPASPTPLTIRFRGRNGPEAVVLGKEAMSAEPCEMYGAPGVLVTHRGGRSKSFIPWTGIYSIDCE